jgi:anaerobic sulfite reductase subunit A
MSKTSEITVLLQNRENLYSLLSSIYLNEVDEQQLAVMKKMTFPAGNSLAGDDGLAEGYALLASFLGQAGGGVIEELAVEYARIFLSAGIAQGLAAFPYESIYASGRLMAQEPAVDAAKLYAAKRLAPNPSRFKVPDDHIGLEAAFMAYLCKEAREALSRADAAAYLRSMNEQRDFLETHLFRWFSAFCRDVERYAVTGFYKAAAKITEGFLERERLLMKGDETLWAAE